MSVFADLALAIGTAFAIIILGYVARAKEYVTPVVGQGLGQFVGKVVLPCLLFRALALLNLKAVDWYLLMSLSLAKLLVFLLAAGIAYGFANDDKTLARAGIWGIFATQSNDIAVGLPIISALYPVSTYPEDYPSYCFLMALPQLAILNPMGYTMMDLGSNKGEDRPQGLQLFWKTFSSVIKNPVVAMVLLGLFYNLTVGPTIPAFFEIILKIFAGAFGPSALFLLGVSSYGKTHVLKGRSLVTPLILVLLKTVALPIITRFLLLAILTPIVSANKLQTAMNFGFIYGSIPTAPSVYVFALQYNIDADMIAGAVTLCMAGSAPVMFVTNIITQAGSDSQVLANAIAAYARWCHMIGLALGCLILIPCLLRPALRRMPIRMLLWITFAQMMFSVFFIPCDQGAQKAMSNYHIGMYFMTNVFRLSTRFWMVATSLALLRLAKRREPMSSKFEVACHTVVWPLAVFLTAIFFVNSARNQYELTCWQLFGEAQIIVDLITMAVSIVFIVYAFLETEKSHKSAPLPKMLTFVWYGFSPDKLELESRNSASRGTLDVQRANERINERALVQGRGRSGSTLDSEAIDHVEQTMGRRSSDDSPFSSPHIKSKDDDDRLDPNSSGSEDGEQDSSPVQSTSPRSGSINIQVPEDVPQSRNENILSDKFRMQFVLVVGLFGLLLQIVLDIALLVSGELSGTALSILCFAILLVDGRTIVDSIVLLGRAEVIEFYSTYFSRFTSIFRKIFYDLEMVDLEDYHFDMAKDNLRGLHRLAKIMKNDPNLFCVHTFRLRKYPDTAIGCEIVDWLCSKKVTTGRDHAVSVGRQLVRMRMLHHCTHEHDFQDKLFFYKLAPVEDWPAVDVFER